MDIEDTLSSLSKDKYESIKSFLNSFSINEFNDWSKLHNLYKNMYKDSIRKKDLRYVYLREFNNDTDKTPRILVEKSMRSEHGVFVVSVVTSPFPEYTDKYGFQKVQKFSCKHNCYYCPNEPTQPRSYLKGEPGVDRANSVNFDVIQQIHIRLMSYINMGQTPDKLEVIVLGGTWSEYPEEYQNRVIQEIYFAANTFYDKNKRSMLSIDDEINLNENSLIHVIGLTLETRPDCITLKEIERLRNFNCTRVQIGVQHTDNKVLKAINRGHTIEQSMNAIKLLLDNGYKVDIHLMPNLPTSSFEKDKEMIETVLLNPNLQVDQWKVYPTSVVPWSVLEKWYVEGRYKPYDDGILMELLLFLKGRIHQRIRLNRIVRDIPEHYIKGGCKTSHMRQLLHNELKKRNIVCNCIRCRSIKNNLIESNHVVKIDSFIASSGFEYFVSINSPDDTKLYGFLRLRIPFKEMCTQLDEIQNCALVRELHVYGKVNRVSIVLDESCQHRGFGKLLLKIAEDISKNKHDKNTIAIISGVGVRNYYRKNGYELDKTFMKKFL